MYKGLKRAFDIVAAIIALLILTPLLLIVMVVLKFTGEGEVFYRQQRIGFQNKKFGIWKFATMLKNSAAIGTGDVTVRNDPRVTTIGRFLRITKINELPQLVNILTGDMSFVGPRPLTQSGFNWYSNYHQKNIYQVVPGLTGAGSLIFRDEESIVANSGLPPHECYQQIIMPYKGELEMWYQDNFSFGTDFTLLLLTGWYIFFPSSTIIFKIFKTMPRRHLQLV